MKSNTKRLIQRLGLSGDTTTDIIEGIKDAILDLSLAKWATRVDTIYVNAIYDVAYSDSNDRDKAKEELDKAKVFVNEFRGYKMYKV